MAEPGTVAVAVESGIGSVVFHHPKKNSLPGALLRELAARITEVGGNPEVRVVGLASKGDGPFCAGASFDEMLAADRFEAAREFFLGFAQVILSMKKAPCFVVARVQGKAVGGGVGLIAAADYALASERASIRLAEFALGFGPFVIGPAVERKTGRARFAFPSIDTDWRDARWCLENGLYSQVHETTEDLDNAFQLLLRQLAESNPEAVSELKRIFWEGTDHWDDLLPARAEVSARMILGEFVKGRLSRT